MMEDIPPKSPAASHYLPKSNAQIVESSQGLLLTVDKGSKSGLWAVGLCAGLVTAVFGFGLMNQNPDLGEFIAFGLSELVLLAAFLYTLFLFKTRHSLLISETEIIYRRRLPFGKDERVQIGLDKVVFAEYSHIYSYRHQAELRLYDQDKKEIYLFGRHDNQSELGGLLSSYLLQQIHQHLIRKGVKNFPARR